MNTSTLRKVILTAIIATMSLPFALIAQVTHTVTFNVSDFSFTKKDSFDVVSGRGLLMSREIGAPTLPFKTINLIVPPGVSVDSAVITNESQEAVSGNFVIYPAQTPIVTSENGKNNEFGSPDPAIYNSPGPYPASPVQIIGTDFFDGATRVAHLRVYPFVYYPSKGSLSMLTQISFTLKFGPSTNTTIHVMRRSKIAQDAYNEALRALVDNPEDISSYQVVPDSIYTDNPVSISPSLVQPDLPPPFPVPGPLTIITSSALAPYLTSFVNQKAADGITAKVVTTAQIYANFSTGDNISNPGIHDQAGDIRQFLLFAYQQGCTWVLIVGDNTVVPVRDVPDPYYQYAGEMVPTDLYYSDLIGNWSPGNLNPNLTPELFVGRLPFSSSGDVSGWTNKLIQYETNPFPGNSGDVTKVLWSVSDEMEDDGETQPVSAIFPSSFQQTFIEEEPSGGAANPTTPTGQEIIAVLNTGFGFYSMDHHGSPAHVAVRTDGYNGYPKYGVFSYDSYSASDYFSEPLNGFDKTVNNCTLLYSIACDVAAYDSASKIEGVQGVDCMAKAWLRVPGGGPAFLGNTREGLVSWSSGLEECFLQQIFSGNTRVGEAEADSKSAYNFTYLAEVHNLFGDPSMIMWTSVPSGVNSRVAQPLAKVDRVAADIPKAFELSQNYPNPFNPSTVIDYGLPVDSRVSLKVYDMLGREIVTLVDADQSAGHHEARFDGTKLSSGVYLYRLKANNFVSIKKMLILK